MKKILIACGAGIATSTVATEKVRTLLEKNNIKADLRQCLIAEVASLQDNYDLIISTTMLPQEFKIPVIKALGYISGIGVEKIDAAILSFFEEK